MPLLLPQRQVGAALGHLVVVHVRQHGGGLVVGGGQQLGEGAHGGGVAPRLQGRAAAQTGQASCGGVPRLMDQSSETGLERACQASVCGCLAGRGKGLMEGQCRHLVPKRSLCP